MALISLEEAKTYLRVDSADEDAMISTLILSAGVLAKDVGRLSDEKWDAVNAEPTNDDGAKLISLRAIFRVAVLYALGYLFEHREEADHHDLTLTLRSLLFSVREGIL
jgi:hypothetical protein